MCPPSGEAVGSQLLCPFPVVKQIRPFCNKGFQRVRRIRIAKQFPLPDQFSLAGRGFVQAQRFRRCFHDGPQDPDDVMVIGDRPATPQRARSIAGLDDFLEGHPAQVTVRRANPGNNAGNGDRAHADMKLLLRGAESQQ